MSGVARLALNAERTVHRLLSASGEMYSDRLSPLGRVTLSLGSPWQPRQLGLALLPVRALVRRQRRAERRSGHRCRATAVRSSGQRSGRPFARARPCCIPLLVDGCCELSVLVGAAEVVLCDQAQAPQQVRNPSMSAAGPGSGPERQDDDERDWRPNPASGLARRAKRRATAAASPGRVRLSSLQRFRLSTARGWRIRVLKSGRNQAPGLASKA